MLTTTIVIIILLHRESSSSTPRFQNKIIPISEKYFTPKESLEKHKKFTFRYPPYLVGDRECRDTSAVPSRGSGTWKELGLLCPLSSAAHHLFELRQVVEPLQAPFLPIGQEHCVTPRQLWGWKITHTKSLARCLPYGRFSIIVASILILIISLHQWLIPVTHDRSAHAHIYTDPDTFPFQAGDSRACGCGLLLLEEIGPAIDIKSNKE